MRAKKHRRAANAPAFNALARIVGAPPGSPSRDGELSDFIDFPKNARLALAVGDFLIAPLAEAERCSRMRTERP